MWLRTIPMIGDAAQVPVLIDGQPRYLVAQTAPNAFYFLLDRTNGKNFSRRRSPNRDGGQLSASFGL